MPPMIVHQSKDYFKDLQLNIPLDWKVNQTPYEYMYRDRRLKYTTQLSNLYGTSPVNNKVIFFDGHDSHFDVIALIHIEI